MGAAILESSNSASLATAVLIPDTVADDVPSRAEDCTFPVVV